MKRRRMVPMSCGDCMSCAPKVLALDRLRGLSTAVVDQLPGSSSERLGQDMFESIMNSIAISTTPTSVHGERSGEAEKRERRNEEDH
jgi:hypothetical protein